METSVPGDIICVEVPYHRSVKRFLQKRISNWLKPQAVVAGRLKDAYFNVKFGRRRFKP